MKKKEELKIVYVSIDELIPAEYNPRTLTEEDRRNIKKSIQEFGLVDPIIVNCHPDRKNVIVGGHQRVTVAKEELGYTEVPCVFVELPLEAEKELNLRLNKNVGRFDEVLLTKNFTKEYLKTIGWKEDELGFFVSEFEKKFDSYNNKNCEMPLVPRFSEKYDAVIIISENEIDTAFLKSVLKVEVAKSYKNSKTGEALIIDVQHFKDAIYGS